MTGQNFSSLHQLVKKAAIHSQQFRHSTFSSRDLSKSAIEEIGFKLVSLYEELYGQHASGSDGADTPIKDASVPPDEGRATARPHPYR